MTYSKHQQVQNKKVRLTFTLIKSLLNYYIRMCFAIA